MAVPLDTDETVVRARSARIAVFVVFALAGIGFTVSIFVTGLAFDDVALQDEAKIGILVASTIAAAVGSLILLRRTRPATIAAADGVRAGPGAPS